MPEGHMAQVLDDQIVPKGAFYILLYPALPTRMHMLSALLVVPFQGKTQHWYMNPSNSLPSLAMTMHTIF